MWRTCVRIVLTVHPVSEATARTVLPSASNTATRPSVGYPCRRKRVGDAVFPGYDVGVSRRNLGKPPCRSAPIARLLRGDVTGLVMGAGTRPSGRDAVGYPRARGGLAKTRRAVPMIGAVTGEQVRSARRRRSAVVASCRPAARYRGQRCRPGADRNIVIVYLAKLAERERATTSDQVAQVPER